MLCYIRTYFYFSLNLLDRSAICQLQYPHLIRLSFETLSTFSAYLVCSAYIVCQLVWSLLIGT